MKRLLLVFMFLGALASSVAAREWTMRSGGFSLEAELIEVKGGNAILKKQDGSMVTIPLNTLSLGDLRYINDTLKAAEAEASGKTGASTPPTTGIAPAQRSSKFTSFPVKSSRLRYAWKEGQTYVYRVRMSAERGDTKENYAGDITYTVKSVRNNEIQLSASGNVSRPQKSDSASVSSRRTGHSRRAQTNPMFSITVDDLGRVVQSDDDSSNLPYLLGDVAHLVIEPLSVAGESSWTVSADAGVSLISTWFPYYLYRHIVVRDGRLYRHTSYREGLSANEKTTYTIENADAKQTIIAKRFELTTIPVVINKPRVEATGDGKLTFDNIRGVMGTLEFSMRITVREKNRTEEIPVKTSYRLLDEAEVTKIAKDAEDAKREKERPLTEKEIDTAIADLISGDSERVSRASALLADKSPVRPNPKAAKALESGMLSAKSPADRANAAEAMKAWGSEENIPALISALNDSWPPVRTAAIDTLLKFKPKQAIAPVAQRLADAFNREAAARFLKAMGPAAERAVLVHIESSDAWTRKEVCEVLHVIGTKASIPALQKAVHDSSWMINKPAEEALAAVKVREQVSVK